MTPFNFNVVYSYANASLDAEEAIFFWQQTALKLKETGENVKIPIFNDNLMSIVMAHDTDAFDRINKKNSIEFNEFTHKGCLEMFQKLKERHQERQQERKKRSLDVELADEGYHGYRELLSFMNPDAIEENDDRTRTNLSKKAHTSKKKLPGDYSGDFLEDLNNRKKIKASRTPSKSSETPSKTSKVRHKERKKQVSKKPFDEEEMNAKMEATLKTVEERNRNNRNKYKSTPRAMPKSSMSKLKKVRRNYHV